MININMVGIKTKIKIVKPKIWNFKVIGSKNAWKEVVYAARVSGVPPEMAGKDVFKMIVRNDYGSALEHIIIKFDIKITKGNAPELLEHRIASHTGYSTRFIKADKRFKKKKSVYEVIVPWHLLKLSDKDSRKANFLLSIKKAIETYEDLINSGVPRESARYALPFCQAVGIYHFTINLRSLLNLLSLRLCVRTSPEFRCIASQLYFNLIKEFPIMRGMVGCRGFMRGVCPEGGVTGVRKGKQHPVYPPCIFKNPKIDIFIPTLEYLRGGDRIRKFNQEKAITAQEGLFKKWANWEG